MLVASPKQGTRYFSGSLPNKMGQRTYLNSQSGASTKEIGGVDEHTMDLCTMGMGWTTDIPGNFHGLDEHTCLFTDPMRLLRGRIATRHIRGKNSQQAFWGSLLHNTLLTQIKAVQRCACYWRVLRNVENPNACDSINIDQEKMNQIGSGDV